MITNPGHGIALGGLELMTDGGPTHHAGWFTTDVSADGVTWGNPEPVIASLLSALTDGDRVTQTRVGNRQPGFRVRITADTAAGLTAGEKALAAVCYRPVELVWQSPDPDAPPTVFDVLHTRMDFEFDDFAELRRQRTYVLTMQALPWGRSQEKVLTPAVAASAGVVVADGTSTTGWSAHQPTGATLSVASGAVRSTYDPSVPIVTGGFTGRRYGAKLRRVGTIDTTTTKLIAVDWKSSKAPNVVTLWSPEASYMSEVHREPVAGGWTRSWFHDNHTNAGGSATTALSEIIFSIDHAQGSGTATLEIDQVQRINAIPGIGTVRQKVASIDPGGSVAAEGDVIVQHETAGLGQVVVYTHPAQGYTAPPLRPWLAVSDTVITDANVVSGAQHPLAGLTRYHIPVMAVPRGDVQLWARLVNVTGTGEIPIHWTARSLMSGVVVGDEQLGYTRVNFTTTGAWVMAPLARLTLPTANIGPAGFVYIDLMRSIDSTHDVRVDEAWLFGMDEGRLTVVDCGTGTPAAGSVANRLKVSAPSLENPFGSLMAATAADFSNALTPPSAKVLCDQTAHRFDPDGSMVFTVASGPATEVAVSFEHYARWHSNAGDE